MHRGSDEKVQRTNYYKGHRAASHFEFLFSKLRSKICDMKSKAEEDLLLSLVFTVLILEQILH